MFLFCASGKLKTFHFLNQRDVVEAWGRIFATCGIVCTSRQTDFAVDTITKNKSLEIIILSKILGFKWCMTKRPPRRLTKEKKVIEPQRHVCFPVQNPPSYSKMKTQRTDDHFILMKWGLLQRSRTETWSSTFLATVINNSTIWNISKREGFTHDLRQINAQASLSSNSSFGKKA